MKGSRKYPSGRRRVIRQRNSRLGVARGLALVIFLFGGFLFFKEQIYSFLGTGGPGGEYIESAADKEAQKPSWDRDPVEDPQFERGLESLDFSRKPAETITLNVSQSFRPIPFTIGVNAAKVPLLPQADQLYRRLPELVEGKASFGQLAFSRGQVYRFILEEKENRDVYLWLDLNRNGNFTDDGEPLPTTRPGQFVREVEFELGSVTGLDMKGKYLLHMYVDNNEPGYVNIYPRTQLKRRLILGSTEYPVYLTDSEILDGNYLNDGLFIDLDGDGRIDRRREYIGPAEVLTIGDKNYRFTLRN